MNKGKSVVRDIRGGRRCFIWGKVMEKIRNEVSVNFQGKSYSSVAGNVGDKLSKIYKHYIFY